MGNNRGKILKNIDYAYKKAPEYKTVFPLIQNILENPEENLAKFLGNSIEKVAEYLEIETYIIYSSSIEKNNKLKAQAKILDICQQLKASQYINAIGGQKLYNKKDFKKERIVLNFLETEEIAYLQYGNRFISNLSIIDIMMFNSTKAIKNMLNKYNP